MSRSSWLKLMKPRLRESRIFLATRGSVGSFRLMSLLIATLSSMTRPVPVARTSFLGEVCSVGERGREDSIFIGGL